MVNPSFHELRGGSHLMLDLVFTLLTADRLVAAGSSRCLILLAYCSRWLDSFSADRVLLLPDVFSMDFYCLC
ncbi:hypothetical protein Tco_1142692 [Tanacetum coccineum]